MPQDALLVLEVADTTLRKDTRVKLPLYARAGIAEVWIENLKDDELLVFRDSADAAYKTSLTLVRAQSVSLHAFPDQLFKIADLLP